MHGLPNFRETLEVLDRNRVECILVGGVAAVLQGAPISTLDTDIVYRRTADNIERLVAALRELEAIYRDSAGRRIEPDATRFAPGGHHLLRTRLGPLDVLATIGANRTYEDLEPYATRYRAEAFMNAEHATRTRRKRDPEEAQLVGLALLQLRRKAGMTVRQLSEVSKYRGNRSQL